MRNDKLGVSAKRGKKRLGRGISSGTGKTSGRGTKGQKARAGARIRTGFEGGQTPIYQRLPKVRGISHYKKTPTKALNVADLEAKFPAGATVDLKSLTNNGLIKQGTYPVKILGDGEITKALKINVPVSKSAKEKIEKAGGEIITK